MSHPLDDVGGAHEEVPSQYVSHPQEQWMEEFDRKFGPKTIWVVPSKDNIETIDEIKSFIKSVREEAYKKGRIDEAFALGVVPDPHLKND